MSKPMTLSEVAVILAELDHFYWCATRSIVRNDEWECDCGKDEAAELIGRMAQSETADSGRTLTTASNGDGESAPTSLSQYTPKAG